MTWLDALLGSDIPWIEKVDAIARHRWNVPSYVSTATMSWGECWQYGEDQLLLPAEADSWDEVLHAAHAGRIPWPYYVEAANSREG